MSTKHSLKTNLYEKKWKKILTIFFQTLSLPECLSKHNTKEALKRHIANGENKYISTNKSL